MAGVAHGVILTSMGIIITLTPHHHRLLQLRDNSPASPTIITSAALSAPR